MSADRPLIHLALSWLVIDLYFVIGGDFSPLLGGISGVAIAGFLFIHWLEVKDLSTARYRPKFPKFQDWMVRGVDLFTGVFSIFVGFVSAAQGSFIYETKLSIAMQIFHWLIGAYLIVSGFIHVFWTERSD